VQHGRLSLPGVVVRGGRRAGGRGALGALDKNTGRTDAGSVPALSSTAVEDAVDTVAPRQVWLDLDAASRTPGRRRELTVLAVVGNRATCRVSDTHRPTWPRPAPLITRISTRRMVGVPSERRFDLVSSPQ
jgi:hypothetical protein